MIWEVRLLSLDSLASVGSMIFGGSRRGAGELVAGRGRLLLLVGGVGCTGVVAGVFNLFEEPRPNGNALREALDGVVRS